MTMWWPAPAFWLAAAGAAAGMLVGFGGAVGAMGAYEYDAGEDAMAFGFIAAAVAILLGSAFLRWRAAAGLALLVATTAAFAGVAAASAAPHADVDVWSVERLPTLVRFVAWIVAGGLVAAAVGWGCGRMLGLRR